MFRQKRKGSDFSAEIEAHIQHESERLREQGLSEGEARAAARRAFGNMMRAQENFYERSHWMAWDHLKQDVRFALRMLRKSPGFTAVVVLTLALGIGANTATFSVVNALLLKSLPYPHPERLAVVYAHATGSESYDERRNIDGEQWERLRDNVPSLLSAISSMRANRVNLHAGSAVQYLHDGRVSAHYFDVLGIQPVMGRNLSLDEDRPHGPKAVLLSYALWRTTFRADPGILGHGVLLKGEPYTVIGVLPEGATTPLNADLYTALQASRDGEGRGNNFHPTLRLRDGANWQQADAELDRAFAHTQREDNFLKDNPGARRTYYCVPLQKGDTEALRPQVVALMLSAGFILLIACANLAGLTLVRMSRRTSEIATRLALGASSWQVQRQLWIENLLVAVIGGGAGIGVGFAALRGLLLLLPQHFLPVAGVTLDNRVLTFTLALSLLTSVLFGMLPALTTRKIDLRPAILSRAVIGGGMRLRQGLIAGEVALTVVLLAGAGLLVRTLIHLETLPPGFNPNGVMTAKASLDDARYHDAAAFRKLLNESLGAMKQIPGVQNAAMAETLPYERAVLSGVAISEGQDAGKLAMTNEVYVTPGYFETMQIPLLAGRTFHDADGPDAQHVVIVNETFARKFFHGVNPIGRYQQNEQKDTVVVGVVADTLLSSAGGLDAGSAPITKQQTIYVPAAQVPGELLSLGHSFFQPSWVVRTAGPVAGLTGEMQRAMESVDPNLPFSGFYDMRELMASTLATQRIEVALLGVMASLALLLSALGIFALVANLVARRTREIGIRMALGSTIQQAMVQIGRAGVGASVTGLVLGLLLCAGVLRAMRSVLYGVSVYDAPTIVAAALTLLIVALLASTVPALRVAKIDPARTLREE
ncbi:MAG TPA: ABC transporter permease [Candidatus Methylomirabilis sp.]|nr:ABC transporter permease [Candidatus Methylomirabilis sp.]